VRLGRLVTQTQRLTSYHQTNPIPCRAIFPNPENFSSRLFGRTAIRSNLTGLCPLSFLVPAVLESLVASTQYRDITEVVPGEADLYCAKYLKQNGGIIFTGDSDLLVHDLGADGAVSLFRDVEFPSIDNFDTLCTKLFQQSTIVDRLALPKSHGLHALAFEMTMDNHCTFPKLLAQAKSLKAVSANPQMYEDYLKEYTHYHPISRLRVAILLKSPNFSRHSILESLNMFFNFLTSQRLLDSRHWKAQVLVRPIFFYHLSSVAQFVPMLGKCHLLFDS
jgi:hypothetical protein